MASRGEVEKADEVTAFVSMRRLFVEAPRWEPLNLNSGVRFQLSVICGGIAERPKPRSISAACDAFPKTVENGAINAFSMTALQKI